MRVFSLVVVCLSALAQAAGPEQPRTVTLDEALQLARTNQPQLQAAKLRLEAAAKEVDAARAAWLPTFGALAEVVGSSTNNSTTTVISNSAVDLPRIGATKVSATPDFTPAISTVVALGARQTLYDFGRISAQTGAASALERVEEARVKNTKLSLELDVKRAFYAVLAAHLVQDASEQAWARAKSHRDFAQQAVGTQVRPPIELTRAEADLARAEVGRIRAASGVRSARVLLAALTGVSDEELDARGELVAATPLPSPDSVRDAALAHDPLLAASAAAQEVAHQQAEGLAAQRRPTLFATASVSGRSGGAPPSSGTAPAGLGLVPLVPNYDLGVVLSWPLFDAAVVQREDAARLRERAARDELAATAQRVSEQALQLAERARVADLALVALERAAQAAHANSAQAEARFHAGLGTSTELADAETLHTEAEINVAIGRFEALSARAALARAMAEETP
ncbi:MAG: TolC family protein [Myxococcota bacterium]